MFEIPDEFFVNISREILIVLFLEIAIYANIVVVFDKPPLLKITNEGFLIHSFFNICFVYAFLIFPIVNTLRHSTLIFNLFPKQNGYFAKNESTT